MKLTEQDVSNMYINGCGHICEGCADDIADFERGPQEPIIETRCIPHTRKSCKTC